jgi:hypothetical protein
MSTNIGHYFESELSHKLNVLIKEDYPERPIMNSFNRAVSGEQTIASIVSFNTSIPRLKTNYEYDVYSSAGMAEFYTCAADDIPLVSNGRETVFGRIKEIALGMVHCCDDIERDRVYGNGQMLANELEAIKTGHDVKLENIFMYGEAAHALFGLTNIPNVAVQTLPADGVGGLTTFASKTPAQQYRDLTAMALALPNSSKQVYYGDTLVLPSEIYNLLNTTIFSNVTDTAETVLSIFLRNQRNSPMGIKNVVPSTYLSGRGTGGTGLALLFNSRKTNLEAIMVDYMRRYDNSGSNASNDGVNFKYSASYHSKTGGIVCYKPLSMIRFDGI